MNLVHKAYEAASPAEGEHKAMLHLDSVQREVVDIGEPTNIRYWLSWIDTPWRPDNDGDRHGSLLVIARQSVGEGPQRLCFRPVVIVAGECGIDFPFTRGLQQDHRCTGAVRLSFNLNGSSSRIIPSGNASVSLELPSPALTGVRTAANASHIRSAKR